MYYNHNIKKKGISDNYLPNYHTSDYVIGYFYSKKLRKNK